MVLDQTANFVRGTVSASIASGDTTSAAREIDAVLAQLGDSLPPGHPRRARLELVKVRVRIAGNECAAVRSELEATAASLAKGGVALLPDLASAQALQTACATPGDSASQAASARATIERLPYVPRRLRKELAALPR